MKKLYLLRHAKSSWDNSGLADHARGLAPRGKHAAVAMGQRFARASLRPDLILCSPARRAIQTLELVLGAFEAGSGPAVEVCEGLYPGPCDTLLELTRALPERVDRVLLLAHNPGLHELAVLLAAKGEPAQLAALRTKFPTAALAVLALSDWVEAGAGTAWLEEFVRPRDLS